MAEVISITMGMRRSILMVFCLLVATPALAQVGSRPCRMRPSTGCRPTFASTPSTRRATKRQASSSSRRSSTPKASPYETAESAPGRGNIWARLKGGTQPALMLLHHIDVVPANKASWKVDPLSGDVLDGYLYGRGALDTKSSGILHLATLIALHRSKISLNRDVIFMATADEEAGGLFGAGWLVKNRPDVFKGVGYVLNEGGEGRVRGGRTLFSVEVTQKVPYWLRLTSRGEPGHGSTPRPESAVTALIAALERLRHHQFEARIVPAVDVYFKGIAPVAGPQWRERFADIATAVRAPGVLADSSVTTQRFTRSSAKPARSLALAAATRSTSCRRRRGPRSIVGCSPIRIRRVSGRSRRVLGDKIQVSTILGFTPAVSSTDTGLYRALEAVCREHFPEAPVVPCGPRRLHRQPLPPRPGHHRLRLRPGGHPLRGRRRPARQQRAYFGGEHSARRDDDAGDRTARCGELIGWRWGPRSSTPGP